MSDAHLTGDFVITRTPIDHASEARELENQTIHPTTRCRSQYTASTPPALLRPSSTLFALRQPTTTPATTHQHCIRLIHRSDNSHLRQNGALPIPHRRHRNPRPRTRCDTRSQNIRKILHTTTSHPRDSSVELPLSYRMYILFPSLAPHLCSYSP